MRTRSQLPHPRENRLGGASRTRSVCGNPGDVVIFSFRAQQGGKKITKPPTRWIAVCVAMIEEFDNKSPREHIS